MNAEFIKYIKIIYIIIYIYIKYISKTKDAKIHFGCLRLLHCTVCVYKISESMDFVEAIKFKADYRIHSSAELHNI